MQQSESDAHVRLRACIKAKGGHFEHTLSQECFSERNSIDYQIYVDIFAKFYHFVSVYSKVVQ